MHWHVLCLDIIIYVSAEGMAVKKCNLPFYLFNFPIRKKSCFSQPFERNIIGVNQHLPRAVTGFGEVGLFCCLDLASSAKILLRTSSKSAKKFPCWFVIWFYWFCLCFVAFSVMLVCFLLFSGFFSFAVLERDCIFRQFSLWRFETAPLLI